ncbi:con-10 family general stress protein [Azospirillum agricola]|uniref:general stress protein n=1 Tax=Azospirillum agricola TaxID=1720247 RepID=UPI000A0F1D4A|nr:KGG domain-containing protein [Azospirillum agricola]SMH35979.1 hypothetical protein SAMN02982994_0958 [Azospirillum lipoferum]
MAKQNEGGKQNEGRAAGGQHSGGNFKNDPERAAQAGSKGGQNVAPEDRSFSKDHNLAAEAGRKGGEHSHGGQGGQGGGNQGGERR